jgi:peptidoglycan hydrolase CwlO-like protein
MASKNSTSAKGAATSASNGFSAKPQPQPEPSQVPPDLNLIIANLQTALAEAQTKEQQLETTIAELQSKVTMQMTTIQDLQTQAQQSQQLQASLEKAEAAARQLATLNETLIAENKSLKASPAPAPAAEPTSSLAPRSTKPHANLIHPVFPNGKPPSGIPDQEIGWFD